jgi:hypothetical protein
MSVSRYIGQRVLNLCNMKGSEHFNTHCLIPLGMEHRHSLLRRLGRSQSRSELHDEMKISASAFKLCSPYTGDISPGAH